MTLVLTLGNPDQVLVIADRRTTAGARIASEEHGKAGILECLDARLCFAYAGLAQAGSFSTDLWLLEALQDSGKPDHFAQPMLERLRARASDTFLSHPALRRLPKRSKRISVLFSGYLFRDTPPRVASAILTNYQHFPTGKDHDEAWDQFEAMYELEPRPFDQPYSHIQRIGMWPLLPASKLAPLRLLLEQRAHIKAVVGRTVRMFYEAADSPPAKGGVGKRLTVTAVFPDPARKPEGSYYTDVNVSAMSLPHTVVSRPGFEVAMAYPTFKVHDQDGTPGVIETPRVSRNAPCPCGSGDRYKHCHGSAAKRNL